METIKKSKFGDASKSMKGYLYQIATLFYLITLNQEELTKYKIYNKLVKFSQEGSKGEDVNFTDSQGNKLYIQVKYHEELPPSKLEKPYLERVISRRPGSNYLFAIKFSPKFFKNHGEEVNYKPKKSTKSPTKRALFEQINAGKLIKFCEIPGWHEILRVIVGKLNNDMNKFYCIYFELCNYFFYHEKVGVKYNDTSEEILIENLLEKKFSQRDLDEYVRSSPALQDLYDILSEEIDSIKRSPVETMGSSNVDQAIKDFVMTRPEGYFNVLGNFNRLMNLHFCPRIGGLITHKIKRLKEFDVSR